MLQNLTRYRRHRGRIFVILVCGFFLLFTPGCSDETDKKVATVDAVPVPVPEQEKSAQKIFQSISAVDAEAMLKTREGVLLIDVRTPQEIKQMKIAGSLAIPVGDVIRGKFVPPEGSRIRRSKTSILGALGAGSARVSREFGNFVIFLFKTVN